jgi:hypothetical protein
MVRFWGSVRLRPVRLGFLVPPDDPDVVARVAQLSACLWGGRYNPIVPFFETGGERWSGEHFVRHGLDVARGYIEFFEPDTLIEAVPGMAEKLGWRGESRTLDLPRVVSLDDFYEVDDRGQVQFAAGIDIGEVLQEVYDTEYKYERRHKQPFADIEHSPGNAFFDVFGGRYPMDERLSYIPEGFREIFSPEKLPASSETAMKLLQQGYAGPFWVSRHGLEESLGSRGSDETFCIFDPTDPGDVIDFWNYRLVHQRVTPISVDWLADYKELMRDQILAIHRPIPGNPFGTKFHSTVQFGFSISDETRIKLTAEYLADLPDRSFFSARPPLLLQGVKQGRNRRDRKILATGKPVSFDEELGSERHVKIPAPAPSFVNATQRYANARWVNIVVVGDLHQRPNPATVYPSNLWALGYPHLGNSGELRIGREGWILHQEYDVGYSLLGMQDGRTAMIEWLKRQGVEATPSEEGQVASSVIATAETLLACGMFADQKTLRLLNEMAESHTAVSRHGKLAVRSTPDRTKHYQEVRRHFDDRTKRSFGFWNTLKHFLDRSVFRAGLRVQCPVCAYYNCSRLMRLATDPRARAVSIRSSSPKRQKTCIVLNGTIGLRGHLPPRTTREGPTPLRSLCVPSRLGVAR